ncbi:MAG: hypothetical protein ACJAYU_004222 [Bradymonadia bacterium]|jgi:hypothetical protein
MLIGPITAAVIAFMSLTSLADGLLQAVIPGSAELSLDEPGTYNVFHEYRSIVDGEVYSSGAVGPGSVSYQIVDPGGLAVTLTPLVVDLNYSLNGRSGVGLASFEVPDGGVYSLSGAYPEGASGPPVVLAVGKGFVGDLLRSIFTSLALAFTGFSIGLSVLVATAVRHSRAKQPANV